MIIRQANNEDIDFLITTIIEAEKSGGDKISYCGLFSITEDEVRSLLRQIFEEEMDGQEICVSNFLIAEIDGKPAGAFSSFIECADGMSSSMIKSNLITYFLDRQKLLSSSSNLLALKAIDIEREKNALQLESAYVYPQFRGRGVIGALINAHIQRKLELGFSFKKAQILLMDNNKPAQEAYKRAGFHIAQKKATDDELIFSFMPGNVRVLMEKEVV